MDIIQDPNKKKRKQELGSEKSSQGSPIIDSKNDEIEVDGECFKLAEDLKGLPEIDYEDSETKKWLDQEDAAFRKRHPNLSYEEATKIINKRLLELTKK